MVMVVARPGRLSHSPAVLLAICFALSVFRAPTAQTTPRTDPAEVAALNSIFRKWNISAAMSTKAPWNTTGDPCSGRAMDGVNLFDTDDFNPAIICDCSSGEFCHITRLKAYKMDIVGTIPDELKYLTKLENLLLGRNHLTGSLPAFMGNFSNLKYVNLAFNMLSGPIPKEIGKLQNLISLGLGINSFNGSIPEELGNMTNLEKLYLDSSGVSGEIPPSLSKLRKLNLFWMSDNDLGGKVPDFIGNLTNLEKLKLQGNNFNGPIPSTFANLVNINELRVGELLTESSSLTFIGNMSNLRILVLRNCKISGSIPSTISQNGLDYLDLSFNNLTGILSPSLFNIPSLRTLYLGNNRLHGILPDEKSKNLTNIDLSYNEFSGKLPRWVGDDDLRLNLVSNNFSRNDFSSGLECLQRDFPCYRGSPYSYSFAINCGGDKIETSNGVTKYEADSEVLSSASSYVTENKRWAVSSVGTFLEAPTPQYTESSSNNIENTSDPMLFQSTRLSPSSLRYYGLALENGNYTVKLEFAETGFPNDNGWKSLGRRIFDIYIQGKIVAKDFNIKKRASGKLFKAVTEEYTASVTENYVEIHLFWSGKGTCCIPTRGYYGVSVSAISVTPDFKPTVSNIPPKVPSTKKKTTALVAGILAGIAALFLICAVVILKRKKAQANKGDGDDLRGLAIMPNSFSYMELKTATRNFNSMNKLGEGGFGVVFKGKLADGKLIAVKQLSTSSLYGKRQFVTEIATISAVKHRNLVNLHGCCYEGEKRLLVYEYLENKSLDSALFGNSELHFDWPTRFSICLGTARGLAYLHEESTIRIVHRDIKASNILLDADLNPKISDFGLAKLYGDNMTHLSTAVAGTIGYLAPEYAMMGHLTEKADVFAFGVVTLEILCGRSNADASLGEEKTYLLDWAWQQHEEKQDLRMIDPRLQSFNEQEAVRMIGVAFLCTQSNPTLRPPMSRVVSMLVGDVPVSDIPSKPTYLTDWQFDDITAQFGAAANKG